MRDPLCKLCHQPMAQYSHIAPRCVRPECIAERRKRRKAHAAELLEKTTATEAAIPPVEIPRCDHCGLPKVLAKRSGMRLDYWRCPPCALKRKQAAKRDRDNGEPRPALWRERREYWAAERRWHLVSRIV